MPHPPDRLDGGGSSGTGGGGSHNPPPPFDYGLMKQESITTQAPLCDIMDSGMQETVVAMEKTTTTTLPFHAGGANNMVPRALMWAEGMAVHRAADVCKLAFADMHRSGQLDQARALGML